MFYQAERFQYEDALNNQIEHSIKHKGEGDLDALLSGTNTWEIS